MRLFAQTVAVITTLLLFSFGTAVLTREIFVMPKLRDLEALADRKDLRRLLLAIETKKQQLSAVVYEYAVWDIMYDYMERPDPGFFDSNFPLDTFMTFNLDFIALFNRNGELIEQRVLNTQSTGFVDIALPLADLRPFLLDQQKAHQRAPIFDSGLIATARGPLLYSQASVMSTDTNSESRGNLLIAMAINEEFREDIRELTQLDVTLHALPADYHESEPIALDQVYRDAHDQLDWILHDNRGRPVLDVHLKLPPRSFAMELVWAPLLAALVVSLIGFTGILILVQRLLIRPIQRIDTHLQRVHHSGDYRLRLGSLASNELGDLSRAIDGLVQRVQTQQEQLQRQAEELQTLSYQDSLSGLANRRRFDQALADNWALAQRNQTPLALLMCDVDYFKSFNDHYGHQRGDEVLRQVGDIIRGAVERLSDIAARYGGEEFAILLPDTTESGALRIAERLQAELRRAAISHGHSPIGNYLTLSIGVASLIPEGAQHARELVRRADEALYSSKADGRDRITPLSALPQ